MSDPYRDPPRTRWKVKIATQSHGALRSAEDGLAKLLEDGYSIAGQSEGDGRVTWTLVKSFILAESDRKCDESKSRRSSK